MYLFVDDERNPNDPFWKKELPDLCGIIWVWVKTFEEAINLLKSGEVKVLSLDHDLGTEKTGYDIAKWIAEQAFYHNIPPIDCRCHSANWVGRDNIYSALQNAEKYWHDNTKSGE